MSVPVPEHGTPAHRKPPRHAFWPAVAVALLVIAGGLALAGVGYARTASPTEVVANYFADLAGSDSAGALALGTVPTGPTSLLTSTVLREQQQIAPISHVTTQLRSKTKKVATVTARYVLSFDSGDQPVRATLRLHCDCAGDAGWRLDRTAVSTQLEFSGAQQRATLLGGSVPRSTVLLFPGAVPLRFDSPYLTTKTSVSLNTGATTSVLVEASAAGRRAMQSVALSDVRSCLAGTAGYVGPACPLPDERYIPGSLRGTTTGPLEESEVDVESGTVGTLAVHASVPVRVSYARLDFRNRVRRGSGRLLLRINLAAVATAPLAVRWTR